MICCPVGESFGSQEGAVSVRDSRLENESSRVGASIEPTSKKGLTLCSIAERNSDPTAVCTQQISTIDT